MKTLRIIEACFLRGQPVVVDEVVSVTTTEAAALLCAGRAVPYAPSASSLAKPAAEAPEQRARAPRARILAASRGSDPARDN